MRHALVSAFAAMILLLSDCGNKGAIEKIALDSVASHTYQDQYVYFNRLGDDGLIAASDTTEAVSDTTDSDGVDPFLLFKSTLDSIDDGDTRYYLVEGDMLLDIDELYLYYTIPDQPAHADTTIVRYDRRDKLIINVKNGEWNKWANNKVVTYCVLKNTFETPEQYQMVVSNMDQATKDWMATCGIKFKYDGSFDGGSAQTVSGKVDFAVRGIDSGGKFIADAFFPYPPPYKKRILIDRTYFTANYDKVGILRHELGHVMGFRHEHISRSAPAVCRSGEQGLAQTLTPYDPHSVMHYFCKEKGTVYGSVDLKITSVDRVGAQRVYGQPVEL